jgi:hypothetical protein
MGYANLWFDGNSPALPVYSRRQNTDGGKYYDKKKEQL